MKKTYDRPIFWRAVKALVRATLSDSFRTRPRTEVSSLLIVQPAAKIQCPELRVDGTFPPSQKYGANDVVVDLGGQIDDGL